MGRIKEEDLRLNIIINGEGKTKLSQLEKQTKMNSMSLDELRKHLKLTTSALNKAVPGTQNWKNLQAEVVRTKQRLSELKTGAEKTGNALGSMAGKYIGIGAAVALLGKGLKAAATNIADFEQANVNLSTILGVNINQMGTLMDDALELGRHTQYTASQVTELQTELAKLGFTQKQIHNMTPATLNFATAVGTDLASAAAMAGATLRIFGLESKDTEDALGVLAVSTNRSALNFTYLQTAMSIVGPVAKSFGFSLRDTTTLLGTLANAGFDASSAATATRNILLNLADSSGKLATALGKPVKTFPELMEGLRTLNARGINLNETLAITDKRSVAAFSKFLSGTQDAENLRDALEDVNGELNRIAETRMDTVQGAVKSLQSAWEGFTLAFSNSKGPIKSFLQWMADKINSITDFLSQSSKKRQESVEEHLDFLFSQEGDDAAVKKRIDNAIANYRAEVKELSDRLVDASKKEKKELEKKLANSEGWLNFYYSVQEAYSNRQNPSDDGGSGGNPTPAPQGGTGGGAGIDTKDKGKWSLNNDEAFLTAKAELTRKFNEGEITSKEQYDEQLYQLEIASLTARLNLHKEKGADRAAIQADIQARILNHEQAAAKEAEKLEQSLQTDKTEAARSAEEKRYQEDLKAFEKSKAALSNQAKVKESIEEKHRRNMLAIDNEAEAEKVRLQKEAHQLEIDNIRNTHMASIVTMRQGSFAHKQAMKAMQAEVATSELNFLKNYLQQLEDLLKKQAGAEADPSKTNETRQAIAKAKAEIIEISNLINKGQSEASGPFTGTGKGSFFGVSQNDWDQLFANLKEGKLNADSLSSALRAVGEMANQGMQIAQQAIAMTNAQENKEFKEYVKNNDKKRKKLDDRLKAGLISQTQYDKELEQLQEEQDAKQEELQARQAERSKRASIAQAIIQSALAVAKTFADFGWPLGIVPAAIMAGLGAAQVALIAATPTGYAEGGLVTRAQDGKKFNAHLSPNKRGYISSPTVLVGEAGGEYVIPADGLNNPSLAPIINNIEAARRAGTLRSINFGAVSPAMSAVPAMAAGGFTNNVQVQTADYSAILEGMRQLGEKMENVRAVVPMLGKGGIAEAIEGYDKIKRRGRL